MKMVMMVAVLTCIASPALAGCFDDEDSSGTIRIAAVVNVFFTSGTASPADVDRHYMKVASGIMKQTRGCKGVRLVERTDLEKVFQEQKFALTGATPNQVELGKILNVDYVWMWSFYYEDDDVAVGEKLLSVKSGAVVSASYIPVQ